MQIKAVRNIRCVYVYVYSMPRNSVRLPDRPVDSGTVGRTRRCRRVNIKAEMASKQFVKKKAKMKKKLSGQFRKLVWFHKVPDRREPTRLAQMMMLLLML